MDTRKNRINIIALIAIIISVITVLVIIVVIGYYALIFYAGMNFANPTGGHTNLPTKLHHKTVREITDSLKKTDWKYNLPDDRNEQLFTEINKGGEFYYFKKSDTTNIFWNRLLKDRDFSFKTNIQATETIIIRITGSYSTIFFDAVYTDSATMISYRGMAARKRKQFENLLQKTVFKDIEKEAKRQGLSDSAIYVSKERLEKYGYHKFAKEIYPPKKFLFWEY